MMKDIPGYEGLYAADDQGVIWSLVTDMGRRAGPLKPYVNTGGYLRVNLFKNKKCHHEYVHRLVASAFIPNPHGYRVVNHINADRTDNRPLNLEWCNQKHNIAESRRMGNQNKDCPVSAISLSTGEKRQYVNMVNASTDLFGSRHAIWYQRKTRGNRFQFRGWELEVEG